MTLALADHDTDTTDTTPMPVVSARAVLAAGDVQAQRSSALVLAEALRHAADLRLADGSPIPGPTGIGLDAAGCIELVMPDLPSVLAWQVLLKKPKILAPEDLFVDPESIAVKGTREGWDWLVRTAAR